MPLTPKRLFIPLLLVFLLLPPYLTLAAELKPKIGTEFHRLKKMTLEELMDIKVSSVSKKEEILFNSAAAISVITQEDIRRSGATTIPEILRAVPGMEVAQIDANKWAITTRGFNEIFSKKLLVLIDGRSVYNPAFAGVFWDVQDTLLEDVDRIEVIRGPGNTLWGANASNGVINIITKSAIKTQGTLLSGGGGTQEEGFSNFRYGDKLNEKAHYRVYGKVFKRDDYVDAQGNDTKDDWKSIRGGFRVDWDNFDSNIFTIQGDIYSGKSGVEIRRDDNKIMVSPFFENSVEDASVSGANILARWNKVNEDQSDIQLQFYYDRFKRKESTLTQTFDTVDLDFQHRFQLDENKEIVWGFGQRVVADNFRNSFTLSFRPASEVNFNTSGFIQSEIGFLDKRLTLILGSKFSYNSFTEFEAQPNARLRWTPNNKNTLWTAISHVVRTPDRVEDSSRVNISAFRVDGDPNMVAFFGSDKVDAENLTALEIGYRFQPNEKLYFDVTGFFNFYDHLITAETQTAFFEATPSPSHIVIPQVISNNLSGETFGIEFLSQWDATDWWRFKAWISWLEIQLRNDIGSTDTSSEAVAEGQSPQYQFFIQSQFNLPYGFEFDQTLRFSDKLKNINIPSYTRLDLRIGYHPREDIEISLVGQNLLDPRHPEFSSENTGILPSEVPRSFYGKLTWRY
jgi:iron complex outermembrane receptor protein